MTFNDIIPKILEEEGGYVNHKDDRGGETNFGITKVRYPNLDIKSLTAKKAANIYYNDFWKRYNIEAYPPSIRHQVMDMIVNHGSINAGKIIQKSLNDYYKLYLVTDGRVGLNTFNALNSVLIDDGFRHCLQKHRLAFYCRIVVSRKTQVVFLSGWLRRALRVF